MKSKEQKRKEAQERQSLSPKQQLAKLDKMFGKNKGAKKERAKLLARLEKGEVQNA